MEGPLAAVDSHFMRNGPRCGSGPGQGCCRCCTGRAEGRHRYRAGKPELARSGPTPILGPSSLTNWDNAGVVHFDETPP